MYLIHLIVNGLIYLIDSQIFIGIQNQNVCDWLSQSAVVLISVASLEVFSVSSELETILMKLQLSPLLF